MRRTADDAGRKESRLGRSDVVVVGAGIVGLSIAYRLARDGARVTLVDARRSLDSASAGNAGIYAPGHIPLVRPGLSRRALRWLFDRNAPLALRWRQLPRLVPWLWSFHRSCTPVQTERCLAVLGALVRLGRGDLEAVVRSESIACSWQPTGWLDVFTTESGRREAAHEADAAERHGFRVELWSGAQLREREPAFSAAVQGALWHTDGVSLDPGRFIGGLVEAIRRHGVDLREETRVEALWLEGDRCRGVRLPGGETIVADTTVVAAGSWTPSLTAAAGLRLPLAAGKGYHLDLPLPAPALRIGSVLIESSLAMTPLGDRLRLAGTLEFAGFDQRLRAHRLELLRRGAAPYLRSLPDGPVLSRWCGLRPCTPDGLPVIGWVPDVSGLLVATGHAKMGLTLAPGSARLAAGLIAGREVAFDAAPLSPARFR
jgi:D-amino-acid dehydrogenase